MPNGIIKQQNPCNQFWMDITNLKPYKFYWWNIKTKQIMFSKTTFSPHVFGSKPAKCALKPQKQYRIGSKMFGCATKDAWRTQTRPRPTCSARKAPQADTAPKHFIWGNNFKNYM